MKNPANKEGPFLGPKAKQTLTVKSATGITKVGNGTYPLSHGDGPLTGATDRDNWGVTPRAPKA